MSRECASSIHRRIPAEKPNGKNAGIDDCQSRGLTYPAFEQMFECLPSPDSRPASKATHLSAGLASTPGPAGESTGKAAAGESPS